MCTLENPFKYYSKDCKTEPEIVEALNHYRSVKETILPYQRNQYSELVASLEKKLREYHAFGEDRAIDELLNKDRLYFYHRAMVLSVEFLKPEPDLRLVEELFDILQTALIFSGMEWTNKMYTDNVDFVNSFTRGEKVIFFINKLLMSGLHKDKTIIALINMYIKICNNLQLSDKLNVDLPSRRDLHEVSFVIPNYSY